MLGYACVNYLLSRCLRIDWVCAPKSPLIPTDPRSYYFAIYIRITFAFTIFYSTVKSEKQPEKHNKDFSIAWEPWGQLSLISKGAKAIGTISSDPFFDECEQSPWTYSSSHIFDLRSLPAAQHRFRSTVLAVTCFTLLVNPPPPF